MPKVIVGLPTLSQGPMLRTAMELGAPVMISATALARWKDEGPVPAGWEFNLLERRIRQLTGDRSPPTAAQKRRRIRSWNGWNTSTLDRVADAGIEIHIDSAGFTVMAMRGGYEWTPESYVGDLAVHPSITRFSSMDLCVEPELANDDEVDERIAKTVRLNRLISALAVDHGIHHKLMPVIQGTNADQYLRCFEAICDVVATGATIGVGSMCRRPTKGPDGSTAILERLHRELPSDVRLHLFGIKGDGAEAACAFGDRIDSIDSQSYGVRARRIANDRRREDPSFSKSNEMVASVMRDWYLGQCRRMSDPRPFPVQPELSISAGRASPKNVLGALERIVLADFNRLIMDGALEHDQIVGGRLLEESVCDLVPDLPEGVRATDPWRGSWQLPIEAIEEGRVPEDLLAA